jgi:hypothetical protein
VLPDYVGHIGPVVPSEWMAELRAATGGDPPLASNGSPPLSPGSDAARFATILRSDL